MSRVKDSQGNILNPPGPGCGRYTDDNSTTIDWFATHPRPVTAKTEFHVSAVPAVLPPNSGDTLKVVAPIEDILATKSGTMSFKTDSGIVGEATLPLPSLSAGVTTSSLPQTAVKE
jgi:hypothetical protein